MPPEIPDALAAIWSHCEPSEQGMTPPSDNAISRQSLPVNLGIAFRHRGDERPPGYPRVLHAQGVVALVDWTPRVLPGRRTLGDLLGQPQVALARLSNVPEPTAFQGDCGGTTANDYLLGVALKFFRDDANVGENLLFATTANGLPWPGFFRPTANFSTTPGRVTCGYFREALERMFEAARQHLERDGFESCRQIDALELDALVEPYAPTPTCLELRPCLDLTLPMGEEFVRALATHPLLDAGTSLYDVVARFEDGSELVAASISLRTRFRVSEWADRRLFFAHPARPGRAPSSADRRQILLLPPPVKHMLDARIASEASLTLRARLEAIRWIARGQNVDFTARSTGLSRVNVHALIAKYQAGGLEEVITGELRGAVNTLKAMSPVAPAVLDGLLRSHAPDLFDSERDRLIHELTLL